MINEFRKMKIKIAAKLKFSDLILNHGKYRLISFINYLIFNFN